MNAEDTKLVKDTVSNLETIAYNDELMAALITRMQTDHPTHQQGFMRLVYGYMSAAIARYKDGRGVDLRNEASAEFAKKVGNSGVMDTAYFPRI